ncbi:MAG: VPLPA-CTERM-specific exosortase XrtD [Deltaproteobacteria bacterium]|nr:VPLPA-CTERM-specific exosortase XrtD [Candidatus Anaeroferrophillacea bacterium]
MMILIRLLVYAALIAAVVGSSLPRLIGIWQGEDYSYCLFIPFVIAYVLWERRQELVRVPVHPAWSGIVVLLLALASFWLGELGGEFTAIYFSAWLAVAALTVLHLGWGRLRACWFSFLLGFTMIPLPSFLLNRLSLELKLVSSAVGVGLMRLAGLSVFREGNIIDLGYTQLQVVDACSGIRYLFAIIVLALILAYFFRAAWWKRLILVFSSVPLIILANGMRIALTGMLYRWLGPAAAEGFFHEFVGIFIFLFALAVMLPEIWLLARIPGAAPPVPPVGIGSGRRLFAPPPSSPWPRFAVATLLLAATAAAGNLVDFRERVPAAKNFTTFPLELEAWHADGRETMERQFIEALDLSDYAVIDYRNPGGGLVNFYVAYYESQRKGESIHSPATCLPGSGWRFRQGGTVRVDLPGRAAFPVNRAFMEKSGYRQLSYYWFPQRGRILTNAYQLKIFAFWDALVSRRTDGALVRLITPIGPDEPVAAADARLQDFMTALLPVLETYIPGRNLP